MMTKAPEPEDIRSMALRIVLFCHLYMNAVAYNWTCIESDAVLMDRTCYIFSDTSLSWEDANKACVDKESILASVFSEEDIREILSQLAKSQIESSSFSAWVGANDIAHEGTFVWRVNNGTVIEDVWKGNLPTNTEDKDCAAIDSTMRLTVEACSEHKPALCMYMLKEPKITIFMDNLPCRCSDGECDSKGGCPNTGKCLIGHFGPGCQYSPVNPFTLAFPFNGSYKDCVNQRFVSLDGFTFDMWCKDGPHVVDDFQISWDDNISVCQIYFNGGNSYSYNKYAWFGVWEDFKLKSVYQHRPVETNPIAWFRTDYDSAVDSARIILNDLHQSNTTFLEVQEFETYGECPTGIYNLKCSWACPKDCDWQGCLEISGLCYRCKDGREVSECKEITTSTTTVTTTTTTTTANITEPPENATVPPTNDDGGMGGGMGGGMSGATGTWRPLPPMSTVVARPPKSENLWEYIVYGLVSAATVLAVVPLLCLCHARCTKPVGEAEAQGDAGNTIADGYSDMDRKLTPAELMALSKGTASKASGLSKSTTSGVSVPSQSSRKSHETASYYSDAITDNTTRTQSTLIF